MAHKSSVEDARLNLIVPLELKRRLVKSAAAQGKKVSALVRESIEEQLGRLERKQFEEKMREAYIEMAGENLDAVEEFKYVDAENL
ncbi:MAG: hypothetical protein ABSG91_11890 [Syntrophobacteraceae bacterium]|jgi:predicted DNA-binding protein